MLVSSMHSQFSTAKMLKTAHAQYTIDYIIMMKWYSNTAVISYQLSHWVISYQLSHWIFSYQLSNWVFSY